MSIKSPLHPLPEDVLCWLLAQNIQLPVYVELDEGRDLYAFVEEYVLNNVETVRSFFPKQKQPTRGDIKEKEEAVETELGLGNGVVFFTFNDFAITVARFNVGVAQPYHKGSTLGLIYSMVVGAPSKIVLESFLQKCTSEYREKRKHGIQLYEFASELFSMRGKGTWDARNNILSREWDTVILPQRAKQALKAAIDEFFLPETEAWYAKKGIPHKMGILLHGPPGCGKTSLISAMATTWQLSVYTIALSNGETNDSVLRDAIKKTPKYSLIVFEDIDRAFSKVEGDSLMRNSVTLSGVLNVLDGLTTMQGCLYVLTTNHKDKLDEALIRNGRVDVSMRVTYCDATLARDMFKCYYAESSHETCVRFGKEAMSAIGHRKASMAALQRFFIVHRRESETEVFTKLHALASFLDDCDLTNETRDKMY
jgi:chaperone BCS1